MDYQSIFERYEMKYRITAVQKAELLSCMAPYMTLDRFGRSEIRNLYFDTDNYRLVRRSIEKPSYKEKLRLRCYGEYVPGATAFLEVKKKYRSVVYKRRITVSEDVALSWLGGEKAPSDSQIAREIEYFRDYYGTLRPRVYLSYEREAYYANDGSDLRITFDENALARTDRLELEEPVGGLALLEDGSTLLEIKTGHAIPIWLSAFLSEKRIFTTSFSKYGSAYQRMILGDSAQHKYKGESIYAD